MFARFDGAGRALNAALGIQAGLKDLGLPVRTGVHTGEIELVGMDVRGVAVHETARMMALAESGEILVSDLTRQLAAGTDLAFTDRGEVQLRGVSGTRHVYRLETPAG